MNSGPQTNGVVVIMKNPVYPVHRCRLFFKKKYVYAREFPMKQNY